MKMAEQYKKNTKPSVGFYDEPGFVSLTTSLRKINGDDTLPTDDFVDIYKNIYDLITPDNQEIKGGILDITLTSDKKGEYTYTDEEGNVLDVSDDNLKLEVNSECFNFKWFKFSFFKYFRYINYFKRVC